MSVPRTVLICHASDAFDREGLAAWLASFTELAGIVVIEETREQRRARVKRELRRVGWLRFGDVVAMRIYQRLVLARRDRQWARGALQAMKDRYGSTPDVPTVTIASINDDVAIAFMRSAAPDIVIARCKQLMKRKAIGLARIGCFVMHPGICPEYRNAHGCFWALAERDLDKVGMTLLKIDAGVDTGPVYGHYSVDVDERNESHVVIQYRAVLDNLDEVAERLIDIANGSARPIDTRSRESAVWGQPWLTRYLRWKRAARMLNP
ncbi:formyl transferase-like protein [Luteibacter rhizovicinus]|uniref:Formyl transferase-like protein n=1 Tax=Luteibacter rhizovicinus TaxID=242606 RepID=A0A4R3YXY5_9GAMM|nr:formyltransferase family protein [Luteibacter rhizovicinus]TCV97611.1 formyl transferase-like protein [Luteibacter rhizovicinus]